MCGANDAVAALAETVSGSEEAFVDAMNEKADKIGIFCIVCRLYGLVAGKQGHSPRSGADLCRIVPICGYIQAEFYRYRDICA